VIPLRFCGSTWLFPRQRGDSAWASCTDPLKTKHFQHAQVHNRLSWRAVPEPLLDFKRDQKVNTIRTILIHQLLSERRFFA